MHPDISPACNSLPSGRTVNASRSLANESFAGYITVRANDTANTAHLSETGISSILINNINSNSQGVDVSPGRRRTDKSTKQIYNEGSNGWKMSGRRLSKLWRGARRSCSRRSAVGPAGEKPREEVDGG